MTTSLFIGRFQPFHKGHLHVAKSLSKKYDKIIIGIGSSQEKNTKNNPFSYNERKAMVSKTLKNNKIKNFKIYPIPDLYDDYKWTEHILKKLPKFDAAYSGNEWTIRCFRKHKIRAQKIRLVKEINSTKIREMMVENRDWRGLVPLEVADYIKRTSSIKRIEKLYRS
ncbi:nicotinamide-nucleotide adenylyltransferase [Candidatus Woesearchaeota archaeon]|nr:nicotinamide-nucleotide adenylyltransferase [Candidatus Woesearchaeota archaeon]